MEIHNNIFDANSMVLYEDLMINNKDKIQKMYFSKIIRLNRNDIYKIPIYNYRSFDLFSDINVYYNKLHNFTIKDLPEDINQIVFSYLCDIDVYLCSECFDQKLKLNKFISSKNNSSNELLRKYSHKLYLNLEKIDGNNKKKYDNLLKNKFPLICTKYCNLYLSIIPKFKTDIIVSFQGILLNNDIRRDLSQNTFTYKSNLMKTYFVGLGAVLDEKLKNKYYKL